MERCEAAAMDFAEYGSTVPPCDEPAEVDVRGYRLCAGCAEALEALGALGAILARAIGRSY